MDVDWALVNKAKNLVENPLHLPILKFPIVPDYRKPLVEFLRPGMKLLDIGASNNALKLHLDQHVGSKIMYMSMDIDRSHERDFYTFDEIRGKLDTIVCFEVVEHMIPRLALELINVAF